MTMRTARRTMRGLATARTAAFAVAVVCALAQNPALGGGGPENALIVIDPDSAESLYVGNYYRQARGIPSRNVLYMDPSSADYQAYVEFQNNALLGTLTTRAIGDHVDYIVIPPGSPYRISAPGLITDACSPVGHFATASLYTMAHIVDDVLAGDSSQRRNEYFASGNTPLAFDSNTHWRLGVPNATASARRYFIGAMLGYTGIRGNTLSEIIEMIDRSVAVDGTRPSGTFYFVQTTDVARSGPRDGSYPGAVAALLGLGANAEHLGDGVQNIVLPVGRHDALGIMTGWATPDIVGADMTILPGAFCDHLTSWAGDFDQPAQTKMSEWITKGASGTAGTIEEPCNYPGKFPHTNMHVNYAQGLSLGESVFRSLGFVPYQVLTYGDPLTRPFAFIPTVDVPDAPSGEVSGVVTLTPTASTGLPSGAMSRFDLHVDGVLHSSVSPGGAFAVNTDLLADGPHEIRVIAFEDSPVATQGRWLGALNVNNDNVSASVSAAPLVGNLGTLFNVDVSAGGATVSEIRLMHNGRVIAATPGAADAFPIAAGRLGAGSAELVAVADFVNGTRAMSPPITLDIVFEQPTADGSHGNTAPTAHSYSTVAVPGVPVLLDLPVTDSDGDAVTITDITQPAQGTVIAGAGAFLLTSSPDASGTDTVTFRGTDGALTSATATVTLNYCTVPEIVIQPAGQEACIGSTATFSVSATGDNLSYQWLHNDVAIPGAFEATLQLDPVQQGDAGTYAVDVTSTCGVIRTTERSSPATLTIPPGITFQTQPQGAQLCIGQSWFGFISAPGADTYQWMKDGVPIAGATSPFLSIPSVTPDDRGEYTIEASNDCGGVLSEAAFLNVVGCGDGDGDGDIDMADFGGLQACFTGPAGGDLPNPCAHYDFDGDVDIDLSDYGAYLDAVTDIP